MTVTGGAPGRPDLLDTCLLLLYVAGIYLGYSPKVAAGVPVPCALAGLAGLAMLLRHARQAEERQLFALAAVIGLYLVSILCVANTAFLGERFKGFIQLSYSLVIGYGAWLTAVRYDRDRLARLFLGVCLFLLIGAALENYTGFRAVSDAVRERLHDAFLYDASLRDQDLYGGIRPKLFTSEPSHLAFAFTAFSFIWYVLATVRGKTAGFLAMTGAAMFLMRSPTLVIGLALVVPYQLLLAGRGPRGPIRGADVTAITVIVLSTAALAAAILGGGQIFSSRVTQVAEGNDPSFFFRVLGPIRVMLDTMQHHPIAGAGLTGEEFIAGRVFQLYVTTPGFSDGWRIDSISEVLTNYFWLHWIYLGAVWGAVTLLALSRFLRTLYVPSIAFCWIVWAAMGHAAGGYVSPKPWAVLILAGAASLLHFREPRVAGPAPRRAPAPHRRPVPQPYAGPRLP